jgi:prepilin-type N-terminal cleavage/methylation domain-containing protein/prepilin-type processing-associated H-X9-DG protein
MSVGRRKKAGAFTLVELLAVVTVIAILAGLILSTVSNGKFEAKRAGCINNQKQLVSALMMYADSDSKHSFGGKGDRGAYPWIDEQWLLTSENLPVRIFFCPATRNGADVEQSHWSNGVYGQLIHAAHDANSNDGYSYDPLLWFADMEDYWNGNRDWSHNSRFVIKTQSSIQNYAHANEAFDMKEKRFGPSRIWLLTDNAFFTPDMLWLDPVNNHRVTGANSAFADGHVEWIPRTTYVYQYEASQDNNRTRATLRPRL